MVNENMKPVESNLLSMTRAIHVPHVVSVFPKAFVEYSHLPNFADTLAYLYTTPALGAGFLECELEMQPGGKTRKPMANYLEHFLFVIDGGVELKLGGTKHTMEKGGYAWVPPNTTMELENTGNTANRCCGCGSAIKKLTSGLFLTPLLAMKKMFQQYR